MSGLDDTDAGHAFECRDLTDLAAHSEAVDGVRKRDLGWGDRVIVRTRNSVYTLTSLGGARFAVSGGWFAAQGIEPAVLEVNGCTWGGRAINEELVAAPGLFLELANGVRTTRIQDVELLREDAATEAVH